MADQFLWFFSAYKRVVYAFCFAVCGAIILILSMSTKPKMDDYTKATNAVVHWESSSDAKAYEEMQKCLQKVPELYVKYRPFIAQKLFLGNGLTEALSLASEVLMRVQDDAPFHAAFAETSLLIEKRELQKSLEQAVVLKEKMQRECHFEQEIGSVLFAHNLLRIAFLQKELQNPPGEKVAWEEVETFLGKNDAVANIILSNFHDKDLDLHHYIEERKKSL